MRGGLERSEDEIPGVQHGAERAPQADDALRRSETRRLIAVEAADVGDYVIDLRTGNVDWGERALAMMRLEPGAAPTLEEHLRLIHPDDRGG